MSTAKSNQLVADVAGIPDIIDLTRGAATSGSMWNSTKDRPKRILRAKRSSGSLIRGAVRSFFGVTDKGVAQGFRRRKDNPRGPHRRLRHAHLPVSLFGGPRSEERR